jgi:hypothetical protein
MNMNTRSQTRLGTSVRLVDPVASGGGVRAVPASSSARNRGGASAEPDLVGSPQDEEFLVIVAVVDSRAARIMTVADFRHSLFVGVPTTFFFNMIVLELTILDTTVDQARTGSSELAWLVLNSRQQALFSALCPCRGAGARRLRFRTWDDFTTSTRGHLAHGRT